MTMAQPTVQRAVRQQEDVVGAALADAFRDDPVFEFLVPMDAKGREHRLLTFFTSMARSYLRRDKHAYVAGDGRGAALWAAPGSWRGAPPPGVRGAPPKLESFGRNPPQTPPRL